MPQKTALITPFRAIVGVILAAAMFPAIQRAVMLALDYLTDRAARWGEEPDYLLRDVLQHDLTVLPMFGAFALPLWIVAALVLHRLRRRRIEGWQIAALCGLVVGLISGLPACGIYVFEEYSPVRMMGSHCTKFPSLVSPGVTWGVAGCLTGLLYFLVRAARPSSDGCPPGPRDAGRPHDL